MMPNEQHRREVEARIRVLRAIDLAAHNMNEEDCIYQTIAEDDEVYTEMVELFAKLVRKYVGY